MLHTRNRSLVVCVRTRCKIIIVIIITYQLLYTGSVYVFRQSFPNYFVARTYVAAPSTLASILFTIPPFIITNNLGRPQNRCCYYLSGLIL